MKASLHYLKLLRSILLAMPVISILDLQAQDYLINFAGTGAGTTVDSVKIENLTLGTSLKMKGSDMLHLMQVTGTETITGYEDDKIAFCPNPMNDFTRMQFVLPVSGEILITLFDISGRTITQTRDFLVTGEHIFRVQGIKEGIYFIRLDADNYSCTGRLISYGSQIADSKIVYENSIAAQEKNGDSQSTNEEVVMQYNTGNRLLLKGISGKCCTIVTDIPSASKTITFNFIPCTDADGNNYPVVYIGTTKGGDYGDPPKYTEADGGMTFMGENLKVTKLNDGTEIPMVTDNYEWSRKDSSCAYCWYLNQVSYKNVFGAYYNWYTVNSGKLCPAGWHVPTFSEFMYLREILGGAEEAGGKLKETGTVHWKNPNTGASNSAGFTALPAGYRDSNGSFPSMGSYGRWWSATHSYISCNTGAWYMELYYNDRELMISEKCLSTTGFSVRCLKD